MNNNQDWFSFELTGVAGKLERTTIHRDKDGKLKQSLLTFGVPGEQVEAFVDWLRTPRPIIPGDFVYFKTGRHTSNAGEVFAIVDDMLWVHTGWSSSSEHAIIPLCEVVLITEEEAVQNGFRLGLRKFNKEEK